MRLPSCEVDRLFHRYQFPRHLTPSDESDRSHSVCSCSCSGSPSNTLRDSPVARRVTGVIWHESRRVGCFQFLMTNYDWTYILRVGAKLKRDLPHCSMCAILFCAVQSRGPLWYDGISPASAEPAPRCPFTLSGPGFPIQECRARMIAHTVVAVKECEEFEAIDVAPVEPFSGTGGGI